MYDWPQSYRRIDSCGASRNTLQAGADVGRPRHRINRETPPISRSHQLHDVKLETASGMSMLVPPLIYRESYYDPVRAKCTAARCDGYFFFLELYTHASAGVEIANVALWRGYCGNSRGR